jgi:hypothetical protein
MSNVIQIKRSTTTNTPASLAVGELAYSSLSGNFFIGETGSVVTKIGGAAEVAKMTAICAVNGILKGNGAAGFSAAVANTDFLIPSFTHYVGTTALALNRASGSQTLTGISIDGSAGTAGSVTGAAQTAITSVGTLTSLAVTGAVSGAVFTGTSFNSITGLASASALMDAASAAVGTSTLAARQDHVHPSDTAKANVAQAFYIGTTNVAINRASANLALTGITSIDGTATSVTNAAQPVITSVGTLTSLAVTGGVSGGVFSGTSFNSITGLASSNPLMDGAAAVGTSSLAARQDHVHASDSTKANLSGATFSGAVTLAADPTLPMHAVTKNYADSIAAGFNPKASSHVATTGNIALTGTQTIDGVAVVAGDRVLVKNQTTGAENGIYIVAAGAWTRATDFDGSPTDEVSQGAFTFISEGTSQGGTGWILTTAGTIVVGTTAMAFTQFAGSTSGMSAHAALTNAHGATSANSANAIVLRDGSGGFSAGMISANLTGTVTGNCSGSAATVTGAAQANITSLGTLVSLAVTGAVTAASFNSITGLSAVMPSMSSGAGAVGTATAAARADHVHPDDTSKADVAQTFYIGTTNLAINRGSAALALTGISSIDGSSASCTGNAATATNSAQLGGVAAASYLLNSSTIDGGTF